MVQIDKARRFHSLHVEDRPLVLFNIWDAGGANAIAESGAQAIATGSWSIAKAHGFPDGQAIPLDFVERIVERIATSVDLPLTVDFEGAYAVEPAGAAENVGRILSAGAVGINFEDGLIGGGALHPITAQCRRIEAIRAMAERRGIPLFINARTDLFIKAASSHHAELLDLAVERARSYARAGASGFFVPMLAEEGLIEALCAASGLPVNVMRIDGMASSARLGELGVRRVSYGPAPFRRCMRFLHDQAGTA